MISVWDRGGNMARTTAIGKQDFGRLIEDNCFYVDKTNFIKEWWENKDDVTLITRPRRFGKTLTMSMLEYFFSIPYAGRVDLFQGLSIWEEQKYRDMQGTYPVIFLSFAGIVGNDYLTVREGIIQELVDAYSKNNFLLNSSRLSDHEKIMFSEICDGMSDMTAMRSLKRLSSLLFKHYGKRVIILLDEYDTPMQEAYVAGYWDEMARFMGGFFNAAFKTNPYLERAVMTGITRISKESIFSGLNNLKVISTTSKKYCTSFGFTENEVLEALDEYGLRDKMPEVKQWYDGFCFGGCGSIYNPWSIICFLEGREFKNYWANTSSNQLASSLLQGASKSFKLDAGELLMGKPVSLILDEEIVFSDLDHNESAIWSLLLASGYLKTVNYTLDENGKGNYVLMLTNLEVKNLFRSMCIGWFTGQRAGYNDFLKALLADNLQEMNIYMNKVSTYTFSSFDAGKKPSEAAEPERFYHGFVLGLIAELQDRYEITSNRESGFGRYDVMLSPLDKADDGIILEFKVVDPKNEKSLQDTADAAIRQILDKKYAATLETKGIPKERIRVYGFAFKGKEVLIDGVRLGDMKYMGTVARGKGVR